MSAFELYYKWDAIRLVTPAMTRMNIKTKHQLLTITHIAKPHQPHYKPMDKTVQFVLTISE